MFTEQQSIISEAEYERRSRLSMEHPESLADCYDDYAHYYRCTQAIQLYVKERDRRAARDSLTNFRGTDDVTWPGMAVES